MPKDPVSGEIDGKKVWKIRKHPRIMDCIVLDSDKEWRAKLGKHANKPLE